MQEPFTEHEPLLELDIPHSHVHDFYSGMTLRMGGVSREAYASMNLGLHVGDRSADVLTNRRRIGERIGFPLEQWICAQQVHGIGIARVDRSAAGAGAFALETVIKDADGLFTTDPDVLLALCFADCVPIFYWTHDPDAVGLLHAGWRGTVAGGAAAMAGRMCSELDISSDRLHVVIGPAIAAAEYEVDEGVMEHVRRMERPLWQDAVRERDNGHFLLDLKKLNHAVLLHSGIREEQIQVTGYSTYGSPGLFFSHRRDHGKTGRMMGYIGMKKKEIVES